MSEILDQTLTFRAIEERIAKTTNPRHLAMLKRVLQHAIGEANADLDMVMETLSENPSYHTFSGTPGMSPSGREAIAKFYTELVFGTGKHVFQFDIDRMVVDDYCITTEGVFETMVWGRDGMASGLPVDDADACYVMRSRMIILWPFDEAGFITGEDSYSAYDRDNFLTKVEADKVPQAFRDYVDMRLLAA